MSSFESVQIKDGASGPASIDDSTNALNIVDYVHHEIHGGSHYFIEDFQTGVANAATIEFVITTPDTDKHAHMTFVIEAVYAWKLEIYEGVDSNADGILVTPYNSNRNSANTSGMVVRLNPTINSDGTKIIGAQYGAGRKFGGAANRNDEMILERNNAYLYRITSLQNANIITFAGRWYEHTPKA